MIYRDTFPTSVSYFFERTSIMAATWIFMALIVIAREVESSTHMKFMTNYCSDTIDVLDSLELVLVPPAVLRLDRKLDFIQCNLDLRAPEGYGIHAHFLHVSIAPDDKHSDRLHLYEVDTSNRRSRMTPDQGLYGMLDRSILSSDYDGSKIEDYTTWERRMRLDYLGKPTKVHSGFRVLITVVAKPESESTCHTEMSACARQPFCIPSALVCDGYPNCGNQDLSDEKGCDPDHLVTDILDKYSLMYDIVVVTCVPALVFIIFVTFVLCLTWRHTKKKYLFKEVPAVSYNPNDDHVQVYDDSYAPPAYSEVVQLNGPPDYDSLGAMKAAGAVVIESGDDHPPSGRKGRRYHHHGNIGASNSSLDSTNSQEIHCVHPAPSSKRTMVVHYDSSDDEETKRKHRRKGGKCKVKGKRRADDLCPNTTTRPSELQGSSYFPAEKPASSSRVYSPSVPYVSFAQPQLSAASSSSSVPMSSPSPPPQLEMRTSPSTESEERVDARRLPANSRSTSSTPDIAVLPVSDNRNKVKAISEEFPHSDSSGVEADRKSETESGFWGHSKNDSKTESCSSLSESRKSPGGGDTMLDDFSKNGLDDSCNDYQKRGLDNIDKSNRKVSKGDNWVKPIDDKVNGVDRLIEDVYGEEIEDEPSYEIDLRSKEAVAVRTGRSFAL